MEEEDAEVAAIGPGGVMGGPEAEGHPTFVREGTVVVRWGYQCQDPRCRATDTLKLFPGEVPASVLNCWKCKGGFQGQGKAPKPGGMLCTGIISDEPAEEVPA